MLFAASLPASAQSFNQAITFGDSNVDSGFYLNVPGGPDGGANFDFDWPFAAANAAGKPTTSRGMMSEVLASHFGLTAIPSNQPGGTNYASSGAKNANENDGTNGGFGNAVPTVTQFQNYLNDNGGRANPNALYLISSGPNDVGFAVHNLNLAARNQYIINEAQNCERRRRVAPKRSAIFCRSGPAVRIRNYRDAERQTALQPAIVGRSHRARHQFRSSGSQFRARSDQG